MCCLTLYSQSWLNSPITDITNCQVEQNVWAYACNSLCTQNPAACAKQAANCITLSDNAFSSPFCAAACAANPDICKARLATECQSGTNLTSLQCQGFCKTSNCTAGYKTLCNSIPEFANVDSCSCFQDPLVTTAVKTVNPNLSAEQVQQVLSKTNCVFGPCASSAISQELFKQGLSEVQTFKNCPVSCNNGNGIFGADGKLLPGVTAENAKACIDQLTIIPPATTTKIPTPAETRTEIKTTWVLAIVITVILAVVAAIAAIWWFRRRAQQKAIESLIAAENQQIAPPPLPPSSVQRPQASRLNL